MRACMYVTLWVVTLALAAPAQAQDSDNSINLHHLYLPADGYGFHTVHRARTLGHLDLYVGASFSHAHRPLEIGTPGDDRTRGLVEQLTVVDLHAAVGLFDFLSVGATLPLVLDNDGYELLDLDSDTRSGGPGALRLQAKLVVFDTRDEEAIAAAHEEPLWDLALGLEPFMTFPTGRAKDYLSDNESVTGGAMVLATARVSRLVLGVEFGYEAISSDISISNIEIEDRLRFGVGLEVMLLRPTWERVDPPPGEREPAAEGGGEADAQPASKQDRWRRTAHTLSVGGELFGWTDSSEPFSNERESPVEVLGYLRYAHAWGLSLRLGIGAGVNNGVGAPDTRYVAQLGWTF